MEVNCRPSIRPDVVILPSEAGVLIRHQNTKFQIEGQGVAEFLRALLPYLNGQYGLSDIIAGLPEKIRDKGFNIIESLFDKGVLRDMAAEKPHNLSNEQLQRYQGILNYLAAFISSPEHQLASYLNTRIALFSASDDAFFINLSPLVQSLTNSGLAPNLDICHSVSDLAVNRYDRIIVLSHGSHTPKLLQSYLSENPAFEESRVIFVANLNSDIAVSPALALSEIEGWIQSLTGSHSLLHEPSLLVDAHLKVLANLLAFKLLSSSIELSPLSVSRDLTLLNIDTFEIKNNRYPAHEEPVVQRANHGE